MNALVYRWAVNQPLPETDKNILKLLALFTDSDYVSHLSLAAIAEKLGLSIKQAFKSIKLFAKDGLITTLPESPNDPISQDMLLFMAKAHEEIEHQKASGGSAWQG
jgi:hypothetical protein